MKQGNSSIETSEGFYSKTPASRLANKEIVKGKKLNVLNLSKKLQKKGIESNKVIEINTMKSESSLDDNPKEDPTSISNTQNLNTATAVTTQGRDQSNCQSALLKKKRGKLNSLRDDIEPNVLDTSQGGSRAKIESILSNKDMNLFKRLEMKAFQVMETMDEKMIEALQRKEYEIVKSFQTTIKRLMNELSALNEKSKNENLALLRDNTIMSLEKQVAFFRDQSYQLNNQMKDLEQEIRMILKINSEKDEDILTLQRTLKNVKAKLINTSQILDYQLQQQSPSPNRKTDSTFLLTEQQQQFHNQSQKLHKINNNDYQTTGNGNKQQQQQSPLSVPKLPDVHSQLQHTVDVFQPITTTNNHKNDLYGQSNLKQNSEMFKQSPLHQLPQTPQSKTQSILPQPQQQQYLKKVQPTSQQSVIVSESQESNENDSSRKKVQEEGGTTTMNNLNLGQFEYSQVGIPFDIVGDPSTYLDIEALVSVYIQDKDSQYLIKNALMSYVSSKLKAKNQIISTMQKQLTDLRQNLAYHNQIQSESNELEQLFSAAVDDTKVAILKRNNYQNGSKFTTSDRIDLISKFMSSEKFMQIVKAKIFNKKCCDNQNCLFNINSVEKKANSLLKQYGTNEQVKNYYASIRELSMEDKINDILDMSIERGMHQGSSQKNNNNNEGQVSLLQKWKMMHNISSKYKHEGSKSMMNNSQLNDSDYKEFSSLIFDQNYLKEMQKNQQKIYRMNNQFRRMFKEEKIEDKEIDERLTGFINETMHKLEFNDPRIKTSISASNNPNFSNTLVSSFSNTQHQQQQQQNQQQLQSYQSKSGEKTRSHSIKVTYRHGKIYN